MGLNFPLISGGPTSGNLTFYMGDRVKPRIELRISCSDTILNYRFSQKLKLLGNGEFNHLTISLANFFFFFLISKKDVYSKNCYMQKRHKAKQRVQIQCKLIHLQCIFCVLFSNVDSVICL